MAKKPASSVLAVMILLTVISNVPALAAGTLGTLTLTPSSASVGDTVTASGSFAPGTWVAIKVVAGSGDIVFFDEVRSGSGGDYTCAFKIPSVPAGTLDVVAGYGSNVASESLKVNQLTGNSSGGGGGSAAYPPQPVNSATGSASVNPSTAAPAVSLKDLAGHWAQANIEKLVSIGAVSGYPDGTFKPDNVITRAEFATMLVKAFKLAPKQGEVFADTVKSWAKDYVATAAAYGIVKGYGDSRFGPDDPITREQMAVMIDKAAKLSPGSGELTFSDSGKISAWAYASVVAEVQAGIMKGYADNTFRPGSNATRAEAVTVILNAMCLK